MKKMNSIPLICGLLSIATFLIYFYSANHAPYSYTDIILLGPVFSFVGLIFSIITRKRKNTYLVARLITMYLRLFGMYHGIHDISNVSNLLGGSYEEIN